MANQGLYIDAKELTKGAKAFDDLIKRLPGRVSDVLNDNAEAIALRAKDTVQSIAADRGSLAGGIKYTNDKPLEKHITSHAPYSAYVEFGTGVYAAQQVSKYPANYAAYAATFKKGRRWPPLQLIQEWIIRKGIVASFHVKADASGKHRRVGTGKSKAEQERAWQMAYVIARAIFKKGIHPHPFLIPALIDQQPKIIKDIKNLLDNLHV